MQSVQINLGESTSSWLRPSRSLGGVIKPLLDALTTIDLIYLSTHHVPKLYESGVRYADEPVFLRPENGERREEFASIPAILQRGMGDCDDLAPWRVAELRRAGFSANIRIQWKKHPNGKLFHIVVRRDQNVPDFNPRYMKATPKGVIEDPSRALGMP